MLSTTAGADELGDSRHFIPLTTRFVRAGAVDPRGRAVDPHGPRRIRDSATAAVSPAAPAITESASATEPAIPAAAVGA
jgi:hypothetical protein